MANNETFNIIANVTANIDQYKKAMREGGDQTVQFQKLVNKNTSEVSTSFSKMGAGINKSFNKISSAISSIISGPLAALATAGVAISIGKNIFEETAQFEKFRAQLGNIIGDVNKATQVLDAIDEAFTHTVISNDEATEAFIRLTNIGINPTVSDLKALADVAVTNGKTFEELGDAVSGALMGSMKGLKQLNIQAIKDGENLILTYHGVTTTIKNTDQAIYNYLISLGKMQGVNGAAAAATNTTSGAIFALKQNVGELFEDIGKGNSGAIHGFIVGLDNIITRIRNINNSPDGFFKKLARFINPVYGAVKDAQEYGSNTTDKVMPKAPPVAAFRTKMTEDIDGIVAANKYNKEKKSRKTKTPKQVKEEVRKAADEIDDIVNKMPAIGETIFRDNPADKFWAIHRTIKDVTAKNIALNEDYIRAIELAHDREMEMANTFFPALAYGFESILRNGIKGFGDLAKAIRDTIIQMIAAKMAAMALDAILSSINLGGGGRKKKRKTIFGKILGGLTGVAGSLLGGLLPFASGGIVNGPTPAILGEYPGAKHNPEIVSPLSDLKNMLGSMNQGGGQVTFVLRGQDLVGTINKYNNSNKR